LHAFDAERLQLASAKARVEGGGIDVVRVTIERLEQRLGFGGCGCALAAGSGLGEVEIDRRVDGRLLPTLERL
jgi:hypothetical protein